MSGKKTEIKENKEIAFRKNCCFLLKYFKQKQSKIGN